MVHIYTLPNCRHCKSTKQKFTDAGVEFTEVDLTTHPEDLAYVKECGYNSAPVIEDQFGHLHPHTATEEVIQESLAH